MRIATAVVVAILAVLVILFLVGALTPAHADTGWNGTRSMHR
jgi:hypothetical protein